MPDIVDRNTAHRMGMTRFFTGEPCKRGHVAQRYVDSSNCVECHKIYRKKFRPSHAHIHRHYRFAGLEPVELWVHPADRETVDAIVNSMRDDRLKAYEATVQAAQLLQNRKQMGIGRDDK